MGWILPTGHNDPQNTWNNETQAYNNDIDDYADTSNGDFLELTLDAISCGKIRIYCAKWKSGIYANPDIIIEVYYSGGWHEIFDGSIANKIWVEKEIGSTQLVTGAKVCCDNYKGYTNFYIYEFEFNEIAGVQEYQQGILGGLSFSSREVKKTKISLIST